METKTTRKRLHARIIAWMMIFAMGMTLLSPCTLSPPVSAAASFVELQPESDSLQFDMKKGDTFYFGNNKKAGGAPIEWRIIGFEGNIATVMSERVLENMSYNTSADNGSWKDSSVCNYLNNEFYNNTFSASEHSMIQPYYGMRDWIQESEGERYAIDIHQKIVLPSLDEIRAGGEWQWTGRDNERVARDIRGFSVFYWLRTTVRMGGNVNARIVNTIGNVGNERGMDVTQAFGLRPVMRVDLSPAVLAEKTTDGAFKLTLPVSSGLAQIPDLKNYAGNITYTSSSQYKANFDAPATVYVTGTTTGADLSVNYKIVNAGQKLAGTGLPIPQGFVQSIQQTLNIAPKQLDGLTDLPQGLYTVSVWLQRNNVDTTKACHEASTPRTFQLDLRNPYVVSVTPNSTGSPTSGSLSITFDREMFSGTGTGTVSIGTTVLPATSRTWNGDNTVVTYPYSGLAANQKYTVNISGFRSFNSTGPQMNADNTHTFSTWPNQHSTVGTAAYTLKVGDRIYLGKDKSDTSAVSDGHPIMWRVVKMDGGIATLLSEYAIGHKSAWYSGLPIASQSANWQDSEAYKYLNNTFYNDSFSAVEKAAIMTSYTTAATTEESDFGSGDNFTIINAGRIGLPAWQNEVNAWFTGTNGRTTTRTSRSTGVNYWFRTRFQLLPVAPFFYNNNTGSFDIGWGSSGNPSFADSLNLRPMLRFDTSKMSYLSKVTSAPEPRYTNMDGTIYHTSTVGANVGGTMGSYYRAMFPGDSGISNVRDSNGRAITGSYPAPVIYGTGGNGMIQINLSSVPAGSQIVYTIRNGTAVLVNEIALKEGGGNWTNGNNGLVLSNLRFDGEFLPKGNYKLDLLLQNPNSNAAVTLNDIDLRVGDPVNDTYFAALKPPVKGANAMTSFSNSQYDATVAWKKGDGTVHTGAFAANTEYVATVTLTPKTGYVMRSVPSNAFDAPGCSTQPTNAVSNGTVTVNYPATADVAVNDKIYFGRNMASTNAPIQWRVVAVDNLARTISVLSENVLELRRFDPTGHKLWYDSEVCDYLNDQGEFSNRGFLSKNFTTSERSAIKPVYGSQFEENGIYTINASSRVVLPSWNELNNAGAWDAAFTSNASRQAVIDGT
ncbi:MAG: Ig-like domain-containing protein, partial [Oscillospiraceae bacterium]|nr:Ig-like domain-containing protein [Oscillospiraceae bacterium]